MAAAGPGANILGGALAGAGLLPGPQLGLPGGNVPIARWRGPSGIGARLGYTEAARPNLLPGIGIGGAQLYSLLEGCYSRQNPNPMQPRFDPLANDLFEPAPMEPLAREVNSLEVVTASINRA